MGDTKSVNSSRGTTSWIYLISYNLFQCLGWAFVLIWTLSYYAQKNTYVGVYSHVSFYLLFFQSLQSIEVLHALFRLVRSPVVTTAMQIASRIMIVWGILDPVPEVKDNFSVSMMIVAWCIAEIVRYTFYALMLIGYTPYIIQFFRYNLFLVLYPVGVTGEILTSVAALPYLNQNRKFSLSLPNRANFSFQYDYFVALLLLGYLPGFPILFRYMLTQRKKSFQEKIKQK